MRTMSDPGDPICADELDGLFARFFQGRECAALAVSGGSDSTALMVLFADWLKQKGAEPGVHAVLTVDHGLRRESAAEAAAVAGQARSLGFAHATLSWTGPKPDSGRQAAARAARYRLMARHMRRHGLSLLLTAHTADDQAETLLMRLARGSGLDGLSPMAPLSHFDADGDVGSDPLRLARPCLDLPKARLVATLEQRGIAWIEDPSNQSPVYERTRVRAARAQLAALGLTTDMLAVSARRLLRARTALEATVAAFCAPDAGNLQADPCGYIVVDGPRLRAAPAEIALRVLGRVVAAAGGSQQPVPLAGLELVAEACTGAVTGSWTLARAKITATGERVLIEREPGREALPELTLLPGEAALWDGRYRVRAGPGLAAPVVVRALGADGVRQVRQSLALPPGAPIGALRALPAFWRAGALAAVPPLAVWADDAARAELAAVFVGLSADHPQSGAAGQD